MIDGKLKMREVTVFRYGSGLRWWLSIVGNLLILSAVHSILMYAIAGAGVGSGRMMAVILVMVHGVMVFFYLRRCCCVPAGGLSVRPY